MEFDDLVKIMDFYLSDDDGQKIQLTLSQNEMLRHINESSFTVVYKRRQEGISFAISIYIFWSLIKNSGYSIIFLYSSTAERELFRQMINSNLGKLESFFLKKGLECKLTPEEHNLNLTKLPNGSTIRYVSKNTQLRGYSADFIYLSELRNKDNFIETLACIFPMIAFSLKAKLVITTSELRNIKDDFLMNGDYITEYWTNSFFDGTRKVLLEKTNKN